MRQSSGQISAHDSEEIQLFSASEAPFTTFLDDYGLKDEHP